MTSRSVSPLNSMPEPAIIDRLIERAQEIHAAPWAEYKQALERVTALDPERLAGGFEHPVTVMDEAAVGLFVSAWADGLRLGAALGQGLVPDGLLASHAGD